MTNKLNRIQHGVTSPLLNSLMLTVSEDGYIRLTCVELQNIRLIHLISGLDDNDLVQSTYGASQSVISGYTEWLSDSTPTLTMGWDWEMDFVDQHIQLRRVGIPRSNIMIQDSNHHDVGYEKSILLQEMFVDEFDWQTDVQQHLNSRYS